MTHGSLFSGLGGFDLAAEWVGWDNMFHCEWNEFGQKVLKYYWPGAELFTDITKSSFLKYANRIDVVSGGFPCQPFSVTGNRKGKEDNRYLWPEMFRAIKEIQPTWVVGENVPGIINWSRGMVVKEIQTDLESEGFTLLPPIIIPACAVNADHRRDRIWFIAHSNNFRFKREQQQFRKQFQATLEKPIKTLATHEVRKQFTNFLPEPKTVSRTNGIPIKLDGITFSKWREESTKGYGNAIVPQIGFKIYKAIEQYESLTNPTLK
jgi:DNA (cytosine-5)-methyltransferase 1